MTPEEEMFELRMKKHGQVLDVLGDNIERGFSVPEISRLSGIPQYQVRKAIKEITISSPSLLENSGVVDTKTGENRVRIVPEIWDAS
jgi:hypothetical protein